MIDKIKKIRVEIDKIDNDIVSLLKKRMDLACLLADEKKFLKMKIVDFEREKEVLQKWYNQKGVLSDNFINKFLKLLFDEAKRLQLLK